MRNKLIYFVLMNITLLGLLAACSRPLNPARPALGPIQTDTPTATSTSSVILSFTPTGTPTPTVTPSLTPTNIFTFTPSATATSTSTTTSTSTPTTTFTPTPVATGEFETTGICPTFLQLFTTGGNTTDQLSSFVLVLAVNGNPETTAGVTLVTPEGNIPIPSSGVIDAPNSELYSLTLGSLSLPYDAGSPYSVIIATSIGTVTSTVIAPGGNVSVSSNGVTVAWNTNGNFDWVQNAPATYTAAYTGYDSPRGITSPFIFPTSAYPFTGQYIVNLYLANAGPLTGTNLNSTALFQIEDDHSFTITH